MLEETKLQEDEYEKQYFGFNTTELYVDFKDQVSKDVKMSLTEMESAVSECDKTLGKQIIAEVYRSYMKCAEAPLEKFKNEIKKIFAIPKNVVLNEDKHKTEQVSEEDIIKLKNEVVELEKELLRDKVFLAKCKQEKEIIDTKLKPTYEKVECMIKSLKNFPNNLTRDEKEQKLIDFHEKHVQYYFNHKSNEDAILSGCERDLLNSVDNFFK